MTKVEKIRQNQLKEQKNNIRISFLRRWIIMELKLKLMGELDHHSAEKMRKKLDREIISSGAETIIFDLSGLTFMDSSGVGVLLGRYKLFATRKLYITGANESIDKVLRIAGVYSLIPRYQGGVA